MHRFNTFVVAFCLSLSVLAGVAAADSAILTPMPAGERTATDILTGAGYFVGFDVSGDSVVGWASGSLKQFDKSSGAVLADLGAPSGYSGYNSFVRMDPSGNSAWAAFTVYDGTNDDRIYQVDISTGTWTHEATLACNFDLEFSGGNAYVSGLNSGNWSDPTCIWQLDTSGADNHDKIVEMSGNSAGLAFDASGNAYYASNDALLYRWASQIHPEDCKMPPDLNLWKATLKYWSKEKAKTEAVAQVEVQAAEKAEKAEIEKIDQIVTGMRGWCRDSGLHSNLDMSRAWALQRLVAFNANTGKCYVMQHDGFYETGGSNHLNLRASVVAQGMDGLIGLERMAGERVVALTVSEILETYGIKFIRESAVATAKGAQLSSIRGRMAEDFVRPICQRNEGLEPTYHAEVDAWMRKMFGQHYSDAENWVANALNLEAGRPTVSYTHLRAHET